MLGNAFSCNPLLLWWQGRIPFKLQLTFKSPLTITFHSIAHPIVSNFRTVFPPWFNRSRFCFNFLYKNLQKCQQKVFFKLRVICLDRWVIRSFRSLSKLSSDPQGPYELMGNFWKNITIAPGLPKDWLFCFQYFYLCCSTKWIRLPMDHRNCYAVPESDQGVLDKKVGFFCLVSRHCNYSLEDKGVRYVHRSSN